MSIVAKVKNVPMGEIGVSKSEGQLRTLLGSCLGVALYDRRLKIAALAHIVLPQSMGKTELLGKFADTAIPEMMRRLQEMAGNESIRLQAKIAGGANMFATNGQGSIGEKNIAAVESLLSEKRIPILGRHLGGEQGRRMMVDSATGTVVIEVVGAESVTL